MDNLFYNLGALPVDIACAYLMASLFEPRDRRKVFLALSLFLVVERVVCGLTRLPLEWTSFLALMIAAMLWGGGSMPSRLARFVVCTTAVNLTAAIAALPWALASSGNPVSYRDQVLSHPEYFLCQLVNAVVIASLARLLAVAKRRLQNAASSDLDARGAVFAFVQAMAMTMIAAFPLNVLRLTLPQVIVLFLMQLVSLVANLLFLRDAHVAVQTSETELQARLLTRAAEGYMRHFQEVEKRIAATAKIRHDLRNQLQVAEALATGGNAADARAMLRSIDEHLTEGEALAGERLPPVQALLPEPRFADGGASMHGGVRGRIWSLSYILNFVLYLFFLVRLFQMPGHSTPIIALCLAVFALWAVFTPYLVSRVRLAQKTDVAQAREKAAYEQLEARVYYGRRLSLELDRARALETQLRESLAQAQGRLDGVEGSSQPARPRAEGAAQYVQYCENRMLDALLALKANACADAGVAFSCTADVPEDIKMESLDLCSLFSNALDNAIRACEELPPEERKVDVAARVRAGHMVVVVRNSCVPGVAVRREPTASRPALEGHGWGLRILKELVRKHGGTIEANEEDGVFSVRMSLEV